MFRKCIWIFIVLFFAGVLVPVVHAQQERDYSPVHEKRKAWKDKKKKKVYTSKKTPDVKVNVSSDAEAPTDKQSAPVKVIEVKPEVALGQDGKPVVVAPQVKAEAEVKEIPKKKSMRKKRVYGSKKAAPDKKEGVTINAMTNSDEASSSSQ